ncbi:MAG: OsmC family protein [Actinomycetota bacterium]
MTTHPGSEESESERIRRAVVRLERAFRTRTAFGRSTDTSTTTVEGGLRCVSEEAGVSFHTDLPAGLGGGASAPPPGALLRAALGSCLAMGYRLRAARSGVELRRIRVTIETDSQLAGMLPSSDSTARPGFDEIRYHVELETDAPTDLVDELVRQGDDLSPVLDVVAHPNRLHRTVSVVTGAS